MESVCSIINGILVLAVGLSARQIVQAQGTTYLSNLGQSSTDSYAVGSGSWYASFFETGTNVGGYSLNSIQLAMADASGNPSGFTVMIYANRLGAVLPGSSLGTLNGSTDPATGGSYTYTDDSNITLLPSTPYFVVLTAGTVIADGAYEWSLTGIDSYNPSGGWAANGGRVYTSSNGSSWTGIPVAYPQFAISATAVPEPSALALSVLGGLGFLWHRRKIDVTDTNFPTRE
jgi:hypothetical protein